MWRMLHWLFLWRAIRRGPRYYAGYQLRRSARKTMWRLTRGWL